MDPLFATDPLLAGVLSCLTAVVGLVAGYAAVRLVDRRSLRGIRAQAVEVLQAQQAQKLHELSGLSRESAEKLLLERLEKDLAQAVASRIQRHEEALRQTCEEKARRILATSIHRYAAEHTADTTVS